MAQALLSSLLVCYACEMLCVARGYFVFSFVSHGRFDTWPDF